MCTHVFMHTRVCVYTCISVHVCVCAPSIHPCSGPVCDASSYLLPLWDTFYRVQYCCRSQQYQASLAITQYATIHKTFITLTHDSHKPYTIVCNSAHYNTLLLSRRPHLYLYFRSLDTTFKLVLLYDFTDRLSKEEF